MADTQSTGGSAPPAVAADAAGAASGTQAPVAPGASGASGGQQGLTYQQVQQVRDMIDQTEKQTDAKISSMEQRLLKELPDRQYLRRIIGAGFVGALTIALTVLGLFYALISHGRDQFGAGAQFATGTVNQYIDAKKAADDQTKQLKEVLDYLKRREEPPKQSKPQ